MTKIKNINLFIANKKLAIEVGNSLGTGEQLKKKLDKLNSISDPNAQAIMIKKQHPENEEDADSNREVKAYND